MSLDMTNPRREHPSNGTAAVRPPVGLRDWLRANHPPLILFAVAVLYACTWSARWEVKGDSAQYLLLSESLARGEGYSVGGLPHTYFPPGFPALLAGLRLLGVTEVVWLNLVMIVLHLLALWCGYLLLRRMTTPQNALLALVLAACSYPVFKGGAAILSDAPFALLILFGLYGYRRACDDGSRLMELGTLSLAAACWFRVVGYPLAAAAGIALLVQCPALRRRRAFGNAAVLGVAVAAAAFWFLHRYQVGMSAQTDVYTGEISEVTERAAMAWLWQPVWNLVLAGRSFATFFCAQEFDASIGFVLIVLPVLAGCWLMIRRGEFLAAIAPAAYLGVLVVMRPPIARYLLPVAPLVALFFVEWIAFLQSTRVAARFRIPLAAALVALLVVSNLCRDVKFAVERHQPFDQGQGAEWRLLARALDARMPPSESFSATCDGPTVAYLAGRTWKEPGPLVRAAGGAVDGLDRSLRDERVNYVLLGPADQCPGRMRAAQQLFEELVADPARFELCYRQDDQRLYRRKERTAQLSEPQSTR